MQTTSSPHEFSRRIGRLTKVLLLLLVLGSVLGAIVVLGTGRPEPLAMAPSALHADNLVIATQAGRTTSDLVYRPLFWAERRPLQGPEPVVVRAELQVERLDQVELVGVISSDSRSGVIVQAAGESRRVMLGEQLSGWTLEAITSQGAEFSRPGDSGETLQESLVLERIITVPITTEARANALNGRAVQGGNNNDAGNDAGNQEPERNANE